MITLLTGVYDHHRGTGLQSFHVGTLATATPFFTSSCKLQMMQMFTKSHVHMQAAAAVSIRPTCLGLALRRAKNSLRERPSGMTVCQCKS